MGTRMDCMHSGAYVAPAVSGDRGGGGQGGGRGGVHQQKGAAGNEAGRFSAGPKRTAAGTLEQPLWTMNSSPWSASF